MGAAQKYGLDTSDKPKTLRWLYLPFLLLHGLVSMTLATQRIAAFFGYQAALGQPWGVAFGLPWYAPWSAFEWQARFGPSDSYGFIEQAMTQSQALFRQRREADPADAPGLGRFQHRAGYQGRKLGAHGGLEKITRPGCAPL